MRNISINFVSECEKVLTERLRLSSAKIEVATRTVVIDPNLNNDLEYCFHLRGKSLNSLIALAIGSWYLKEAGFLLRMDLEEKLHTLSNEDQFLLKFFLSSKGEMLLFLKETTLWSTRDFFGNLLPLIVQEINLLRYSPKRSGKVVKKVFRRGYNDKGSRALDPYWKQARPFWQDSLMQTEIELERKIQTETFDFTRGFLT